MQATFSQMKLTRSREAESAYSLSGDGTHRATKKVRLGFTLFALSWSPCEIIAIFAGTSPNELLQPSNLSPRLSPTQGSSTARPTLKNG